MEKTKNSTMHQIPLPQLTHMVVSKELWLAPPIKYREWIAGLHEPKNCPPFQMVKRTLLSFCSYDDFQWFHQGCPKVRFLFSLLFESRMCCHTEFSESSLTSSTSSSSGIDNNAFSLSASDDQLAIVAWSRFWAVSGLGGWGYSGMRRRVSFV